MDGVDNVLSGTIQTWTDRIRVVLIIGAGLISEPEPPEQSTEDLLRIPYDGRMLFPL